MTHSSDVTALPSLQMLMVFVQLSPTDESNAAIKHYPVMV